MLSIKQAAEAVSISPSTIRYYDEEGLLPFVKRDSNGYRQFEEQDLFWLEIISCMRATGMSIRTLRHIAELHMKGNETLAERIQIFEEHKEKLHSQKQDIDKALDRLDKKMDLLYSSSLES